MTALGAHDGLSNLLGDRFGPERGEQELAPVGVSIKELGRDIRGRNERGPDLLCVVDGAQLHA